MFKTLLNTGFVVLNAPFLMLYFLLKPISRKDTLFAGFSQCYSLVPGQVGNYLRRNFYRFTMMRCGKNVVLGFGTVFSHADIEIGDNVYIGPQGNIGLCQIDADCLLGSGVHIMSGKKQHNFKDATQPLREQGGTYEKITLGTNVWVGNCALIMASVGERSVIGAGAVVVSVVESLSVMSGNPAALVSRVRHVTTPN